MKQRERATKQKEINFFLWGAPRQAGNATNHQISLIIKEIGFVGWLAAAPRLLRKEKTKEPITSCRGGGPQPQHRSKNELKKSKLK